MNKETRNTNKRRRHINLQEQEFIQDNLEYNNKDLKIFIADIICDSDYLGEKYDDTENYEKPDKSEDSEKTETNSNLKLNNTNSSNLNNSSSSFSFKIREEDILKARMDEMHSLVKTYGAGEIVKHIQKKSIPNYKTYIGTGKLEEIIDEMKILKADILIIGEVIKPHQVYNINNLLKPIGAKCWDRVDLILKIFEKNAKSIEARLQIELASIRHMGPRIFGMGMELSRQGGGIGSIGKGETNTEIMKRHLAKRTNKIKSDLAKYSRVRDTHRKARQKRDFKTAGIVGYTNAGKSTFLNAITGKGAFVQDALFATLGTSVGKMWVEPKEGEYIGREYLLTDTIGFIRDLPPALIKAFKSTLEDSIESDLLLHVIDASDPELNKKIKIVEKILEDIGAKQKRLYVFNKIDNLSPEELEEIKEKYEYLDPIFISAHAKIGLDNIKKIISEILD